MPLEPEAREFLLEMAAAGAAPLEDVGPEQARADMEAGSKLLAPGPELHEVEDLTAEGRHGGIPIRCYRTGSEKNGAIIYFHGGGWVIGSVETHDAYCRHLAEATSLTVCSVDYRLAPENPFPAPFEDALDSVEWVSENAETLRIDASRLAVAGDSAGGNLAAAVSLACRDLGVAKIARQVLTYPITDYDLTTESYREFSEGYYLTRDSMDWFWRTYLEHPNDSENPYVRPMQCMDLGDLPDALVITAEYDPLRDEGEFYASRMVEQGVRVTQQRFLGMIHGFIRRFERFPQAQECLQLIADFLSPLTNK